MADAADNDDTMTPPPWLWRLALAGLALAGATVAGLALALALGAADPRPAGPLRWQMDFKAGSEGWTWLAPEAGRLAPEGGALLAEFAVERPGQMAVALTDGPTGDFTFEVAAAAVNNTSAAYGVVFAWRDQAHYSAVLVNGNGYAQAYQQDGAERREWFAWQQWPHLLAGDSGNRVRVDVRGDDLTVRVNDEVLVTAQAAELHGQIGAAAASDEPAVVVFSWARLWGR